MTETRTDKKAARAEKVAALHQRLDDQHRALVTSDDWLRMLATASRFHRYSPNNILLIGAQRPDATRVAGYRTWQKLGRQVRKGEKGIAVLAPCRYKQTDDDTGDETWRLAGFKAEHVFDISQTDGEPLDEPVRAELLDGEAPAGMIDALADQVAAVGFTVTFGQPAVPTANGTTEYLTRRVTVRDDVSDAQQAKTLAHELAHVMLHEGMGGACRGQVEVEAESVAYIVAGACGLDTDGYSLPYVASWSGGDSEAVAKTADRVVRCASEILGALDAAEAELERQAIAA